MSPPNRSSALPSDAEIFCHWYSWEICNISHMPHLAFLVLSWSSSNLHCLSLLCPWFQSPALLLPGQMLLCAWPFLLGECGEGKGWRWAAPWLAVLQQEKCFSYPYSQDKLLPKWCPQGSVGKDPGIVSVAFFQPLQWSKASRKIVLGLETW